MSGPGRRRKPGMSAGQQRLIGWLVIGVFVLAIVVDSSIVPRVLTAFADFAQDLSVLVRGWVQ